MWEPVALSQQDPEKNKKGEEREKKKKAKLFSCRFHSKGNNKPGPSRSLP